jgi:retron-type reverse transcriptase
VAAHEVLHEVHSKKFPGLVLKLDYEKAYDRIGWNFLDYMLETRNFGPNFRRYVKAILHHGSLCVRINDINNNYFVAGKGLKQGDPLSPILYNLVADVFSKILFKAASRNFIQGLLSNVIPGGVISLQYC